jgi:hypothetical protein
MSDAKPNVGASSSAMVILAFGTWPSDGALPKRLPLYLWNEVLAQPVLLIMLYAEVLLIHHYYPQNTLYNPVVWPSSVQVSKVAEYN